MTKHASQLKFTDVVVIYNPNSSGPGKSMAQDLKRAVSEYNIRLAGTKYAGHAEKLAYSIAKTRKRPLIISASGDGGYHEVVNGLIRAQLEGAHATAGLLPAGNANDHYHAVHDTDLATAITAGTTQSIDLLKLTTVINSKPFERYAHSYIGLGLTPKVGKELNKTDLNWFNEIWIVLKTLFVLQPVGVILDGKRHSYDSLIFSNIGKMSKVLTVSQLAVYDDGKFEVTVIRRRSGLRLMGRLLKATTRGLAGAQNTKPYVFQTIKKTLVQIDGEISTIDSHTTVTVTIEPKLLKCIV